MIIGYLGKKFTKISYFWGKTPIEGRSRPLGHFTSGGIAGIIAVQHYYIKKREKSYGIYGRRPV